MPARMMHDLVQALLFLTRLPVPPPAQLPTPESQGRAVLYYPLVGLIIGGLLAAGYWLIADTGALLQAALLLSLWVGITGALHLDGLADLTDAWIGGQGDRERTLEIMKDPRSGPMAVVAVVLLLIIKLAALETLLGIGDWLAVVWVPVLGRAALVLALLYIPYVRPNGLGSGMAAELPADKAKLVLLLVALLTLVLLGLPGLALLLVVGAGFFLMRLQLLQRLGGMTGDAAGALCELLEALALVALALLL